MFKLWRVCLLVQILCCVVSYSSSGDRSMEFRVCVIQCVAANCSYDDLPLSLRILGWNCDSNCQYECMRNVTDQDVKLGRPIRQFYGKWPFVRFLGVQEPASVLFSVLNGVTVAIGYHRFRQQAPDSYPYHSVLRFQYWVTVHAWLWSTIFHSRDVPWTEKLDYFSAAALIMAGLFMQFVRITGYKAVKWHLLYGLLCVGLFGAHVSYLSFYKFDYGYNMAASVGAGAVYTCIWMAWAIKNRKQRRYGWKCVAVVMATTCLLSLELLDFPPLLWTFDAHSIWHLSTIPLPLLWYSFVTDDAHFEIQRIQKIV